MKTMYALIEIVERAAAPDVRTVYPRRMDVVLDLVECLSHLDVELINVLVYEGELEDPERICGPLSRCTGVYIWRWRDGQDYLYEDGTVWTDSCATETS